MTLEPKAMDIIKATSDRLAAARTMSFTAVVSYESASRLCIPLVYTTRSEVTLQRPDKLRIITPGDGPAQEFYYDGKTMTAFAPAENLIAVAEAPPTIDAALKAAFDSAAIYFPFANIMAADPYKHISDGLVVAFYIGQSHEVGGTTTDMVAYANNNVFLQAWVGAEDKLPRRVRATYRTDLAQRRHQIEFSNWQLDLAVPADAFAPKNAGSANPIAFAHPNPQSLPYAKPPAKSKSSKTKGKKASEECELLLWSRDDLVPLIMANGKLSWEFSRLVIQRVQFASEIVEHLAFQPLTGRVARLLLEQYPTDQDVVHRHLTLDEMASRVGTTREIVCRILYRFAEQGAIQLNRTEFTFLDRGLLEEQIHRS